MRSADPSGNGNGNGNTPDRNDKPHRRGAGAARAAAAAAAQAPSTAAPQAFDALGPDELLARFFSAGDEAAFGEVVRRYAGMVFATCLRVTRDAHDAEDATQATFLTLAVQCKTGKPVRKLTPWLQQVAKRAALDLKRSRTRRETHERRQATMAAHANGQTRGRFTEPAASHASGLASASASASGLHNDELDLEKVNRVLAEEVARLPAKYRLPLISLYFGGMSRQDVAKEVGCTPAALSVRVHRGRQMLAKRLSARGVVMGQVAGKVLAGGVLAAGLGSALREALVARTAESVAAASLGKNLTAAVGAGVLSIVRTAAFGAAGSGLLAKLKAPVLLVLLLVGVSAGASGQAGKLRDAVIQWTSEWRLTPGMRSLMQKLRSPFRAPRASATGSQGGPTEEETTGPSPAGGAGGGRTTVAGEPRGRFAAPPPQRPAPAAPVRSAPAAAGQLPRAVASAAPPIRPTGAASSEASRSAPTSVPPPARRTVAARQPFTPPAGVASRPRATGDRPAPPPGSAVEGDVSFDPGGWLAASLLPGAPSDGAFVSGPALHVGVDAGTRGTFRQAGGSFWAVVQDVGRFGTGRFTQLGGFNSAQQLRLGGGAGGAGSYDLLGGVLAILTQDGGNGSALATGIQVGGAGRGDLLLGDANSAGAIAFPAGPLARHQSGAPGAPSLRPAPGADLVIRGDPRGSGQVRGWGGAIGNGGMLVNNGRIVADGYGVDRALIILGYSAVTNTIDNPATPRAAGGGNGWFARNNGRLILPKIATAAGTNTYTWGENPADPAIDLVNSVRLTLRDARHVGKLDVSLLDRHRADVPELPRGHTFIGVWSIDTGTTRPEGGVDLTVRYDDGLARELGLNEPSLKLWRYGDDTGWFRINDDSFSRDLQNHTLSGHSAPGLTFFAVSAPEPGAAATTLLAAGALLLRRRRQGRKATCRG